MRVVGFTGTRGGPRNLGMTEPQCNAVRELFFRLAPYAVHHGDCVGADSQFHAIVRSSDCFVPIYIHPCNLVAQRAHCVGDAVFAELPPLERNREIIKHVDVLIAAPAQRHEQLRSGTWATVRYAREAGKLVFFAWPDGTFA